MTSNVDFENVDNSSALANSLFTALTTGITLPAAVDFSDAKFNFDLDENANPLYEDVSTISLESVTTGCLDGDGVFDKFMSTIDEHLKREYKDNRLTGTQYAEVYTALVQGAMGQATQFVLQKDQARWAAITAQMQARIAEIQATTAVVELEKIKADASRSLFETNLTAAQVGLTKMQIATEEANHNGATVDVSIKEYQRTHIMPADLSVTQYERNQVMPSTVAMNNIQVNRILPAQAAISEFQNRVLQPIEQGIQEIQRDRILTVAADVEEFRRDNMLPIELAKEQHLLNIRQPIETDLIREQRETQRANTLDTRSDNVTPVGGLVGQQIELVDKQVDLTTEQFEAERAKTLDTRSDGVTVVVGSVGKQKDLYTQQIDSFVKDAAHKTAKMYLDGWITQKTLDEGLTAPAQLTNVNIDSVLATVRSNNSL